MLALRGVRLKWNIEIVIELLDLNLTVEVDDEVPESLNVFNFSIHSATTMKWILSSEHQVLGFLYTLRR